MTLREVDYQINDEFKEEATRLSDLLDLDQLEAAELLLQGTEDAETLDRTPIACAVIHYHAYRSYLSDSLRMVFRLSLDLEAEDDVRGIMDQVVRMVLGTKENPSPHGSAFTQKCINTMSTIELWLNVLAERVQKELTLGQTVPVAFEEIIGLQQQNLNQQHETLGLIIVHLINGHFTKLGDFKKILEHLPKLDKWNVLAVHYAPALIAFCHHYAPSDGDVGFDECKTLHGSIIKTHESNLWPLRNFHAAFITWWLAEYNSWFFDASTNPVNTSEAIAKSEAQERQNILYSALKQGALQCTLSICTQIRSSEWYDPARIGLIRSLLYDAPILPFEPASINVAFQETILEQFEVFTDAFITNMPDTLRKFKADEDDHRKLVLSGFQPDLENDLSESDRHLERFFVIMSYVYEGRPDAADVFWADTDGDKYGFLRWFSNRVSTPLISAFCEMFRSISAGETYAAAAHVFLLDDVSTSSSRIRRISCLTWAQIFEELDFYASKIKDPAPSSSSGSNQNGKPKQIEVDEPETPVMLECYLRLIAHLCKESGIVRQWILDHQNYKLIDTLFTLSNNSIPARIRACAYGCLRNLLNQRTLQVNSTIWIGLDQWVSSGFSAGSNIPRPARLANNASWAEDLTFDAISADHDEADAFVSLLQALLEPPVDIADLNDTLLFPEELGSSYRMPGVEPYVDLVMGKIFATKVGQAERSLKQHVLASNILWLVQTCLESFNENLIVLGNKSNMPIDSLIGASSLSQYAQLHPFSRIMEWMFNDRVLLGIFKLAHQSISDVNSAQPDSPLIVCLWRTIRVMNLVMKLQSTYLDIVRPLTKNRSAGRHTPVLNPALASFEDAVATNLRIVVDLCYYSGSGHKELVLESLELLKQFAACRKLNAVPSTRNSSRLSINRLVGALVQNSDVDPVAVSMSQAMGFDDMEIAQEHTSAAFDIKFAILDFLEKTLCAHPEQPNIAHALLGFGCTGSEVKVEVDSLFARGSSLFHVIMKLAVEYPEMIQDSMRFWSLSIKCKAITILRTLWSANLTSQLVLNEMTEARLLFWQWLTQSTIDQNTLWDGLPCREHLFVFEDSANALDRYLRLRCALYDSATLALRSAEKEGNAILQTQITSTLLGVTVTEDTQQPNPSLFELADFMDFEIAPVPELDIQISQDLDFGLASKSTHDGRSYFDLSLVEELLMLRRKALRKAGLLTDEGAEERMDTETRDTLAFFNAFNNHANLAVTRTAALKAWADQVIVLVQSKDLEAELRSSLVLQTIQIILPKLDVSMESGSSDAIIFARLAHSLLSYLSLLDPALRDGRSSDGANDRLFNLFKVAIKAIGNPATSSLLREVLYNLCYHYLASLCPLPASTPALSDGVADSLGTYQEHAIQTVKLSSPALIDILCDDSLGATPTSRIAALLLLDALTRLAASSEARYLLDALVRSNFITVLVETLAEMPAELSAAPHEDAPGLVTYYKAKLTLLLTLAQTRLGAVQVLNAGLFGAVHDSGLFAVDPDLRLQNEHPAALRRFYELLLAVLRVIAVVVVARGPQNAQTLEAGRDFLAENRLSMVGVLKREARVTAVGAKDPEDEDVPLAEKEKIKEREETDHVLGELAETYVLLTSLTGFLEVGSASSNMMR